MLRVMTRICLVGSQECDQRHLGGQVYIDLDLALAVTKEARPRAPWLVMGLLPVDTLGGRKLEVAPARGAKPGRRRLHRLEDEGRRDPELPAQIGNPPVE